MGLIKVLRSIAVFPNTSKKPADKKSSFSSSSSTGASSTTPTATPSNKTATPTTIIVMPKDGLEGHDKNNDKNEKGVVASLDQSNGAGAETIVSSSSSTAKSAGNGFAGDQDDESTVSGGCGQEKSLRREIKEFVQNTFQGLDKDTLKILRETTRDLMDMEVAEKALRTGQAIQQFTLPDMDNHEFNSSKALEKGPIVLVFYKGNWCPLCHVVLNAFQRQLKDFEQYKAQLVAVSPNVPDVARLTVDKNEIGFPVLSDKGNTVAKQFGVVFTIDERLRPIYENWGANIVAENGNDDSFEIPLSSIFVIQSDGRVAYSHIEIDYTNHPEPSDILAVLSKICGPK